MKNPTCCDDIWRVIKTPNLGVKGNVYDEETGELIGKAVVKLVDGDKIVDTFYTGNGAYRFNTSMGKNYTVSADKDGYVSATQPYSTANITSMDPDADAMLDIFMRKATKGGAVMTVSNVYYDFDLQRFQPKSIEALDSLAGFMNSNPSISVEVYSNTDGRGTEEYNDELSIRRAQEVINYLSNKGVDKARMTPRPQGKRVKADPNETRAGRDNPEARALNRRTYFRIIGDVPGKRIQYDNNRPEYIDKTGSSQRGKNLDVKENEDADQGTVPVEVLPKQ